MNNKIRKGTITEIDLIVFHCFLSQNGSLAGKNPLNRSYTSLYIMSKMVSLNLIV